MKDPLDPRIESALKTLQDVPKRNIEDAVKGRAQFLSETFEINKNVSNLDLSRHKGWNDQNNWINRIFRKETSPMFTTIASVILAIALALGGSGLTVAAAQSSNSDEFLYPIKLLSEDVRLGLTTNAVESIDLELEFLNRRTMELHNVINEGKIPTTGLMNRIRNQFNITIELAAELQPDDSLRVMEQVRTQMQTQEQLFQNMQNGSEDANVLQTRTMLQNQIRLVDSYLNDPQMTQDQLRQRLQEQLDEQEKLQEQIRQQDQIRNQTLQPEGIGTPQGDQNQFGQPENQGGNESPGEPHGPSGGSGSGGNGQGWQTGTPTWQPGDPTNQGGTGQNKR
jgi:hypothetical protein